MQRLKATLVLLAWLAYVAVAGKFCPETRTSERGKVENA